MVAQGGAADVTASPKIKIENHGPLLILNGLFWTYKAHYCKVQNMNVVLTTLVIPAKFVLKINPASAPELMCARFLTKLDLKSLVGEHSYRKKRKYPPAEPPGWLQGGSSEKPPRGGGSRGWLQGWIRRGVAPQRNHPGGVAPGGAPETDISPDLIFFFSKIMLLKGSKWSNCGVRKAFLQSKNGCLGGWLRRWLYLFFPI